MNLSITLYRPLQLTKIIWRLRFHHNRLPANSARILLYCRLHFRSHTLGTVNHFLFECNQFFALTYNFEELFLTAGAPKPWFISSLLAGQDPLVYTAIAQFIFHLPSNGSTKNLIPIFIIIHSPGLKRKRKSPLM